MAKQDAMDRLISEAAFVDDPAEQYYQTIERQRETFLNNITDPYARETAKNIIETDFNNF
jgi:hypothetical protein